MFYLFNIKFISYVNQPAEEHPLWSVYFKAALKKVAAYIERSLWCRLMMMKILNISKNSYLIYIIMR
jgi:hypothetical protein